MNMYFHGIFLKFFDLVKNAKKRRGQQRERAACKARYPSGLIRYF